MKRLAIALLLMASPASAADLFSLYASGKYEDAMRAGADAKTSQGFAIAARAALAEAAIRPEPCLECLRRAEDFARRAVAADAQDSDGHVWLASALGLEGRIIGLVRARLADSPGEAKTELDAALKYDPRNAYALAAMGGWNIEIVRAGGTFLARTLYGAREAEGIALFDRAVKAAPGNVAVRYQIGLSLAGYGRDSFRTRIGDELGAAISARPQTSYEKFIQLRAVELLALLKKNDRDSFDARVHKYQGYP